MLPFVVTMNANSPDKGIFLRSSSKDVHTDLRNPLLKTVAVLVAQHTEKGYDRYTDPQSYITNWASKATGTPLTVTAITDLPSVLSTQKQLALELLEQDKNLFDTFLEMKSTVAESTCFSSLYRLSGNQGGNDIVVLAGMDYQCARLNYSSPFFSNLSESTRKLVDKAREKLGSSWNGEYLDKAKESVTSFVEAGKNLTASDLMSGGIIGKMLRNRKNGEEKKSAVQVKTADTSNVIKKDDGNSADLILYGAYRRYLCIALAEREAEATAVFLNFIRSIQPDESLDQKEITMINQKLSMIRQQAAINQNIALQKTIQLRRMQADTSAMIARNARAASDGLMDSWKRKMDSDSRISQNYSEAIRGVNTYQNSYGQNVDVSVSADHVYENRYGDVYGVSGSEIDQDILNSLNWKKIG